MARWPFTDQAGSKEHSSLRTILIFSAMLVPFAAVPYILTRRQYIRVHKELTALRAVNESLAREMRRFTTGAPKAPTGLSQEVLARVKGHTNQLETNEAALTEVKESLDVARAHLDDLHGKVDGSGRNVASETRSIRQLLVRAMRERTVQDEMRAQWEGSMEESITRLAAQNQRQRSVVAEDMREAGRSLANVARFMEEVEIRQGWTPLPNDGRGIGRMRNLAKHLEDYAQSVASEEETKIERNPAKTRR